MALAVRPDMRKYKMGTKIIEESIKMAREAGAEYYKGKKEIFFRFSKKDFGWMKISLRIIVVENYCS